MLNPECPAYNLSERMEIFKFVVGAKVAGTRGHWALLENSPDFFSAGVAILLNFNLMMFSIVILVLLLKSQGDG